MWVRINFNVDAIAVLCRNVASERVRNTEKIDGKPGCWQVFFYQTTWWELIHWNVYYYTQPYFLCMSCLIFVLILNSMLLHHVPLQYRIISIFARTEEYKKYIYFITHRGRVREHTIGTCTQHRRRRVRERPNERVSESNNKNNGSKLLCNSSNSSKTDIDFRKMYIHNRSPHHTHTQISKIMQQYLQ